MTDRSVNLDNDAQQLYAQLGGVELRQLDRLDFSKKDKMLQGLLEEEKQADAIRFLLAHMVFGISSVLHALPQAGAGKNVGPTFQQLEKVFGKFWQKPTASGATLIRYRGMSGEKTESDKNDYEIVCGNIMLDAEVAAGIARKQGQKPSRLLEQLSAAFETFSQHGISNFMLKIPRGTPDLKRFWTALQIVARFFEALEKDSGLITLKLGGRQVSIPPVYNERNLPDANLTLLALLNGVSTRKIQEMVKKVDVWMQRSSNTPSRIHFSTTYDAILNLKNFQKKLIVPPIEVNNIKWLMVNEEQKTVTEQMVNVARLVMDASGGSSRETARVLKSVYGDDYAKIDSNQVVERLQATSGLLDTIDGRKKGVEIETEVLDNVQRRLGKVNDEVYDNLYVDGDSIRTPSAQQDGNLMSKVHRKILGMVTFYKNRSATKKKMTAMVHSVIDFDDQDYDTLARDFGVTVQEAEALIRMLKGCFDGQGNFRRSAFGRIIPDLEKYERRIFEFLWHNLKETLHQKDRQAFLDSLQLLVDRLKQPKNSISVLLDDLIKDPDRLRFADQKALMLGNRLVRSYHQEIVSYQITPEDVLAVQIGLDKKLTRYAAWKIDRNQDKFFEKIRTIHRRVLELLGTEAADESVLNAQDVLALEREAYIFFALIGGNTAKSVLVSALKEYGFPESEIYQLCNAQEHLADLLQMLKVVVRGIRRQGNVNDVGLLNEVKSRLSVFAELTRSMHEADIVNQIRDQIYQTVQDIQIKD